MSDYCKPRWWLLLLKSSNVTARVRDRETERQTETERARERWERELSLIHI